MLLLSPHPLVSAVCDLKLRSFDFSHVINVRWCAGQTAGTATDDYLAHFIVKEFVDAEAETMEQVRGPYGSSSEW